MTPSQLLSAASYKASTPTFSVFGALSVQPCGFRLPVIPCLRLAHVVTSISPRLGTLWLGSAFSEGT